MSESLTEKTSILNLIKGQVHVLAKKLIGDERFIVKTRYASFAIRGTKFGVSIDEVKNKAYLCVCEGIVAASINELSVDVKKDEDLWIGPDDKKLDVKSSPAAMRKMTIQLIDEMDKF